MHTCNKTKCYFVIYTGHWTSIEIVDYDDDFWQNKMEPKLEKLEFK